MSVAEAVREFPDRSSCMERVVFGAMLALTVSAAVATQSWTLGSFEGRWIYLAARRPFPWRQLLVFVAMAAPAAGLLFLRPPANRLDQRGDLDPVRHRRLLAAALSRSGGLANGVRQSWPTLFTRWRRSIPRQTS